MAAGSLLVWQFEEPWPSARIATFGFDGRLKLELLDILLAFAHIHLPFIHVYIARPLKLALAWAAGP